MRRVLILTQRDCRKKTMRRYQHSQGYQSMGSFHSDDLGVLMSLSDDDYKAPSLPFDSDNHSANNPDFMLDRQQWTFLNHGAFGAALRVGYDRAEAWRYHLEQQPLRYFDRDLLPHLAYATRRLAKFASSSSSTETSLQVRKGITLIQNSTAGLNSILRGYARVYGNSKHYKKGPRVLLWDTSYGSVKKMAQHVFGHDRVMEIPLQEKYLGRFVNHENPSDIFLKALDYTMNAWKQQKEDDDSHILLVLDHTTSNTAINMPINEISLHAKETYGQNDKMHVLVDGAHGLLAQDLDLQSYCMPDKNNNHPSIDFYLSNGHKWLSCPRGVGMLFCPHEHLRDTVLAEPAIISHGVEEEDLLSRFVWDGTRDYTAALALPAVLDLWESRAPHKVRNSIRANLIQGIQILVDHWHNDDGSGGGCVQDEWLERGVTLVPPSMLSPMALVRLPKTLCGCSADLKSANDAKSVQDYLFDNNIEVPIKSINGTLYARISCHIYNTMEEFDRLGKTLSTFR